MKFGMLSLDDAEGAVLARSLTTPSGALKKGRRLAGGDIARLREAGIEVVMAARFEAGDVVEDEAAHRIAVAAAGNDTEVAAAFTGRANLFASAHGLALIDAELLLELNRIDEGLRIATLARYEKVLPGQMAATIKVITFAIAEEAVAGAEKLSCESGPLVRVAPFIKREAGLILTLKPGSRDQLLEKRVRAVKERVEGLGSELGEVVTCAHEQTSVRQAVAALGSKGANPILIFGGTAIVDRGDVIPAALREAGGEIIHLGMLMDPGSLLLLGALNGSDVIGFTSCAGWPKINGFDWVLERRLAGLTLGPDEMTAMGLGGLPKETQARVQPRRQPKTPARPAPKIAIIVLAAGRSTRMGARNKLLEDLKGEPIVTHVARQALASKADKVIAVTGFEANLVEAALADHDLTIVANADYAEGLSTSLRAGVAALKKDFDGVIICLGDMPQVEAQHLDRLIVAFAPNEGRSICAPIRHGRRGNPVLWGADFFDELAEVKGDAGAKHLIGEHEDQVAEVDLDSDAIFVDVDTPESLWRLRELGSND